MIGIIIGTRPEIIKMSPIIRGLEKQDINYFIVHTGQHHTYNMDKIFFEKLSLPDVDYNLNVGSGTHGEQTAKMLVGIEKILIKDRPGMILVQGDTNTALAGAIASCKLHIKVGHIEAGLRSYDRSMPEEINRILVDHSSDCLFSPTNNSRLILLKEGIDNEKIFVTGNTIVDAVSQNIKLAKDDIIKNMSLRKNKYILLTIHRQENVDNKNRLYDIIDGARHISEEFRLSIICPLHPRTKKMIKQYYINENGIKFVEPLDYLNFLVLENNASLILTDSGGVQEESCILKVPCVTLRENTERPETLEVGSNILAGTSPTKMVECTRIMLNKNKDWENPFGDGNSGERIINIISRLIQG